MMNLIGLMPVRNEDWILGFSARVALMWCDSLVVLEHACTDETSAILDGLPQARLVRLRDPGGEWPEMEHRQRLLTVARGFAATHVALIDADEVLAASLLPVIRESIAAHCTLPGEGVRIQGYNLRRGWRVHTNGLWGNREFDLAFKLSDETAWGGDRYHQRLPAAVKSRLIVPLIKKQEGQSNPGVMHFWGFEHRRLLAKHRMYRIQERLRYPDKAADTIERMYSLATDGIPGTSDVPEKWEYAEVPLDWTATYDALCEKHMRLDAAPWQEAWCEQMIATHGIETFAGLRVEASHWREGLAKSAVSA